MKDLSTAGDRPQGLRSARLASCQGCHDLHFTGVRPGRPWSSITTTRIFARLTNRPPQTAESTLRRLLRGRRTVIMLPHHVRH